MPDARRTDIRALLPDVSPEDIEIIHRVQPYTMVGPMRLHAFIEATRHVTTREMEGAIVECGVWRGGATMASMLTLMQMGKPEREFYLYDTFEGMNVPTEHDVTCFGAPAAEKFAAKQTSEDRADWCRAEIEGVREAIQSTGYPSHLVHFVKGKVEDTIPGTLPGKIAVLRLDTDWYESTRHELIHLYPHLINGGVLLIDDYGHWQGARKAVDEYLAAHAPSLLLHRVDY
ncbi:MAG: class I SAM-dependent methyltransferase, partial [Planctomycetales bacterium]|nr:class I SAM-dependent methyltransferase [Planctomycetales bacterium]